MARANAAVGGYGRAAAFAGVFLIVYTFAPSKGSSRFDFGEGGTPVRDMTVWWAAHGPLPQSGTGRANANLFAKFYIASPAIRHGQPAEGAVD